MDQQIYLENWTILGQCVTVYECERENVCKWAICGLLVACKWIESVKSKIHKRASWIELKFCNRGRSATWNQYRVFQHTRKKIGLNIVSQNSTTCSKYIICEVIG